MKKTIKILGILVLLGILIGIGINVFMCIYSNTKMTDDCRSLSTDKKYDAVIVLGCGVINGEPSRMLKDRLNTAIEIYNSGICKKIIMSGDHGNDGYDEVNTMLDYAVEKGVSKEDIFLDHAGFSTYESMNRASTIFGLKSAIIVTQEYHLYRAVFDARLMGIDAYGVEAISEKFMEQPYYSLREFFARIKDLMFCIIKPDPTYLGDKIDINGDSSVTFDR